MVVPSHISLTEQRLAWLEQQVRLFRRRFRLALAGYLILALGILVALFVESNQIDKLHDTNERVAAAAGAFCEAGLAPDAEEPAVLMAIAEAKLIKDPIDAATHRVCRDIVRRLLPND